MSNYRKWDEYYLNYPLEELGWELGKPRPILVEYLQEGFLPKSGRALDICCGVGTNTVYLAQKGFEVVGIDVSKTTLKIAKQKTRRAKVDIDFIEESFIDLSFREGANFVYDMGCFHHVEFEERTKFITALNRVLKSDGVYLLTCFSYRNGPGWNHFTMQQLIDLFSGHFLLGEFRHYPSLEGDGVIRFFYKVLMEKKSFYLNDFC